MFHKLVSVVDSRQQVFFRAIIPHRRGLFLPRRTPPPYPLPAGRLADTDLPAAHPGAVAGGGADDAAPLNLLKTSANNS
jgi:hypothetical protein